MKALVLSTDPAHSLADSLEVELGPEPVEVAPDLWGQEVTAISGMKENWDRVSAWMTGVLASQGVDRVRAEELTVPPGMDELFSLLEIKRHWDSGEFDVLVIDCAPTGETLKLLGFPEIARWWMEKIFPWNRSLLSKAAPLAKALDIALPEPEMIEQVEDLVERLVGIDEILKASDSTSVRLVMNPDRMVIDEARRTFTHLCLYGYRTDAVIVNRLFPDEVEGTYFDAWRSRQTDHLDEVEDAFSPITVLTARYFDREVRGSAMQDELADELFEGIDPAATLSEGPGREVVTEPGRTVIRISVPFVEKGDLGLRQQGDELIVTLGDLRRTIILPSGLRARQPSGAAFEDGRLEVIYEDDR